MYERIDLYLKDGRRWKYVDATRMCKTLAEAERRYAEIYGQPVKAKWSERQK